MKIFFYQGGKPSYILLLSEFDIYSGGIQEIEETEVENWSDNTEIIVGSMHYLHYFGVFSYLPERLADGLGELSVGLVGVGWGEKIYNVVFGRGRDLHDGDEGGSLAVEVLNIHTQHWLVLKLVQSLNLT